MIEKVRIVIAEPNRLAKITFVEQELKFQQKLVGGYLESIKYGEKFVIMCNEEGKIRGLEPNRFYQGNILVGTFFVTKFDDDGELVSLTEGEAHKICMGLDKLLIHKKYSCMDCRVDLQLKYLMSDDCPKCGAEKALF